MLKKIMKITLILVAILSIGLFIQHIYAKYLTVFQGKVVDAASQAPLEGVAVVAVWNTERMSIAEGGWGIGYLKETLTDKNGEWKIKGESGHDIASNIMAVVTGFGTLFMAGTSVTKPPHFIFFKPGYCSTPKGDGLKACEGMRYTYVDGKEILHLPKLNDREDRLEVLPPPADGDRSKQKNFMKLINTERRSLGLDEFPLRDDQ